MKKICAFALIFALLLSLGWGGFKAVDTAANPGDVTVEFTDDVNISTSGANVKTGDYSHYFEYRTCIVHTSHGDYVVYFTNTLNRGKSDEMNQFSVIKINPDGTTKVVFQEWKPYDSSQVSLHVDKDENVWALVAGDNSRLKDQFDGRTAGLAVAAYRIDAETDEAIGYTATLTTETEGGFGYAAAAMDTENNRVYAFAIDGKEGIAPSYLYWAIFDIEAGAWEKTIRRIEVDARHGYHYIYADGKGGVIVISERNSSCNSAITYYPEISAPSHPEEGKVIEWNGVQVYYRDNLPYMKDVNTGEEIQVYRWDANYVWDKLDAYYIPDVYSTEFECIPVADADYSRVIGDLAARTSLEGRKNNEYPSASHQAGDCFLDKDGNLHVLYMKSFSRAAYDRATTETQWWHAVYNVTDPANMVKLWEENILEDEIADGTENAYRMYEDSRGNLYVLRGCHTSGTADESKLIVYALDGSATEGYEYREIASHDYKGIKTINISNNRSNSTEDNTIGVMYRQSENNDTYHYMQLTLKLPAVSIDGGEVKVTGTSVDMKDQNGKDLSIAENELSIKAVDEKGKEYVGTVAADGAVTFAPFVVEGVGEHTFTFTMVKGEDKNIAYSTDTFVMTVKSEEKDGKLETKLVSITKNGETVEDNTIVFTVVKTVADGENPGPSTGDNNRTWLWISLVAVAALAAAAAVVLRKKAVQK